MTETSSQPIWQRAGESLQSRADFVRAACVLEATAPKPGNVNPNASFDDLNFEHFVKAADCTASALGDLSNINQLGPSMKSAVQMTRCETGTNVNLGIVLLLGPLLASETRDGTIVDLKAWRMRLTQLLDQLTLAHGGWIAQAIASASAGGIESSDVVAANPLNLNRVDPEAPQPAPYDLMEAMRQSSMRDRIARQYSTGFEDIFEVVVPTLFQAVDETHHLLSGIVLAQVRLIASWGDSLIARKCGVAQSQAVQELAKNCLQDYSVNSIKRFDDYLRGNGNRLNPGTTADLLAAGLYVCLRSSRPLSNWASPKGRH